MKPKDVVLITVATVVGLKALGFVLGGLAAKRR